MAGARGCALSAKGKFIKALVEFEDGCKDFYGNTKPIFWRQLSCRVCRIVARASEIVEQILKWAFGYFNTEKQSGWTFFKPDAREKLSTLSKTDRRRAIAALVQLIQSTKDEFTRGKRYASLGKIGTGNPTAITALVQLIESTEDELNRRL
jgi:hypothetical protein